VISKEVCLNVPGLQQAAAARFDEAFGAKYNEYNNESIEIIH